MKKNSSFDHPSFSATELPSQKIIPSVVDALLQRERTRNVGTVSFSPTAAIAGAFNRYFVNRADRSDLINKALLAYFAASGATLWPDGRIDIAGQKEIEFEPTGEGVTYDADGLPG